VGIQWGRPAFAAGFEWGRQVAAWVVARANITSERGASAVEYGVLVSLIAAVVMVAVIFLGKRTSETFSCTASNVAAGFSATGC
jgi:Flp pilus assembly pilin Flp